MINPDLKNVIKGWDRNSIASKIANDLPHASYVNLGIGMPELVSQHIKEDREIIYHSENGLLGMGPTPNENEIDLDLINAGKKTSYDFAWWKFLPSCRQFFYDKRRSYRLLRSWCYGIFYKWRPCQLVYR